MKKNKIIFYATTIVVSGMMLFSAYMYLTNPAMTEAFHHIGFPDFFRVELAIAKILGAIALLVPMVLKAIKVFAYVGFAITFISAFIAHLAIGDTSGAFMPVLFLGILGVSYLYYNKLTAGNPAMRDSIA